ncbi:hypothetical protein BU23DRAFT_4966 [Bimuria novae-zelandiae CBS 107.79]|uniref:Uncharacterized protein n=1 Tax=Bimuria novae-zelandiae CBS 107.79 TaxID=1447943 RepID=A0A6A5VTK3_9PLEO|nr:hypothetical protein BU23DRAFT_4966 [Bimuria novae-zelandiae CBS 107.79]
MEKVERYTRLPTVTKNGHDLPQNDLFQRRIFAISPFIPTSMLDGFLNLIYASVHFAQLKTLALGQFIFSHDHQFEWIISHAETLQELYLDHCSILYQYGAGQRRDEWLDKEGYPITDPNPGISGQGNQILTFGSYATRWHDIFGLFSVSLSHLHTFRFGTSPQWKFDVSSRYDDGSSGMPVIPWKAECDLTYELFQERYVMWSDWSGDYFSHWKFFTNDVDEQRYLQLGEEPYKQLEQYPACTLEDERALRAFLKKLGVCEDTRIHVVEA